MPHRWASSKFNSLRPWKGHPLLLSADGGLTGLRNTRKRGEHRVRPSPLLFHFMFMPET